MIFRNRRMVKGEDLNGAGHLFGGKALAWCDEESAIFVNCQINSKDIVTKAMSKIDFKAPAHLGDIIEIGCEVVRFGKTSVTVSCTMRNKTTKQDILVIDEITFVHLGADGRSSPHGVIEVKEN